MDAKFVFVLDGFKEKYLSQLHLALHSLRTRGGAAREMECILLYVGEVDSRIEGFCRDHRLTLQPEQPLFGNPRWNKLLMSRVTRGDVVCFTDVDVLFAADPTPILEACVRDQAFYAAEAGNSPLRHGTRNPLLGWWDRLFQARGWREWEALFRRYGKGRENPPPVIRSRSGERMLPNYNSGVLISPPDVLPELGRYWEEATRELAAARDDASTPLARHLRLGHANQISLGVAVHAAGIPWKPLDYRFHFSPLHTQDPDKRAALARGEVAIIHYAGANQRYLTPDSEGPRKPAHAEIYAYAQEIIREAGPFHGGCP